MDKWDDLSVSPDWLEGHLDDSNVTIVDASWYLPAQQRNGFADYQTNHIPNAVFFDQDDIVEPGIELPHALPSPNVFSHHVSTLGIGKDHHIVVYDGLGLFSAPRAWWMLKTMGAKHVCVLQGGLDGWMAQNRPVQKGITNLITSNFVPEFNENRVVGFDEMMGIVENHSAQIVDARPAGRFSGKDAEPRAGMRSGHMPGAANVPAQTLCENGRLLDDKSLRAAFLDAGVDFEKPIVTSCGSGVTAAILVYALETLGFNHARLYDGSWSQWGSRQDTAVVCDG